MCTVCTEGPPCWRVHHVGEPTMLEGPPRWRPRHVGGCTTLEGPPRLRAHHEANVKIVIEVKRIDKQRRLIKDDQFLW